MDLANDCISRQAAIDALIALTVYSKKREIVKEADNYPNTWIEGVAECIDEIEDLPSTQPENIRCKDCAKCQIDDIYHDYWCEGKKVWENHFCGYAERRTDE